MEKDPKIRKLLREAGIEKAPAGFTEKVMSKIGLQTAPHPYRPLIGRAGKILILLFIAAIVAVSLLFSEQGGSFLGGSLGLDISQWQWPVYEINLDVLRGISFSPWMIVTAVALLLLLISDTVLHRRRMT